MLRTILLTACLIVSASAQEFEVASVKPAVPDEKLQRMRVPPNIAAMMRMQGGPGSKTPGKITYKSVTLKMLIAKAYDIPSETIQGPGWLAEREYDISATLPKDATKEQFRVMLQHLLEERFHLAFHREQKLTQVYALTVAKDGHKLPPPAVLRKSMTDEERQQYVREQSKARMEASKGRIGRWSSYSIDSGTTMEFAKGLFPHLDLPVLDETHLEGKYSFKIEWNPARSGAAVDDEPEGDSIFDAIKKLGLNLRRQKGEYEFLVVDKADQVPVGN